MLNRFIVATLACAAGLGGAQALAESSAPYLTPNVKAGDRFSTIFSKAVSIKGDGFDEYVGRVSGTGSDTVVSVTPDVISETVSYRYDGRPGGSGAVEIRDHGMTDCSHGKCHPNDQTSATFFNPYLWGKIPSEISLGDTWSADIAQPWEIGPKGEETVRVVRLDHDGQLVTLEREGNGEGPSSDDAAADRRTIVSNGKKLTVKIVPGPTEWEGYTTVAQGITLSDEIMARRHVSLIADTGEKFEGEERVYTLFVQMPNSKG